MIPCIIKDDDRYFCIPKNNAFNYDVFGRTDFIVPKKVIGNVYRRYSILVELCNKEVTKSCK
jgi:hypothetical protein